jgi:hypothetical protein
MLDGIKMYATITEHAGMLVCELLVKQSNNEVLATVDTTAGYQIILNTKKNLGMSLEAVIRLLQLPEREQPTDTPDLEWLVIMGMPTLAWMGGPNTIIDPRYSSISQALLLGDHLAIPNIPNPLAVEAIDAMIAQEEAHV